MKKAIILLAHGSKIKTANQDLEKLALELDQELDSVVKHANLQFAEPSFAQSIEKTVNLGVEKIIILPLFIFAGRHVKEDIPQLIEEFKAKYPDLKFELRDHLTANSELFRKFINQKLI